MSSEENEGSTKKSPNQQIRYVPMNIEPVESEEDKIDVSEVLTMLWDSKRIIIVSIGIFFLIGLFIATFSADEYTTQVELLPEEQSGFSLGALGGIARQFGFSSRPNSPGEAISANLYPAIISSNIFLEELMSYEVPLPDDDQSIPLEDYISEYQQTPLISNVLGYTIFLPFKIISLLRRGEEVETAEISKVDRVIADEEKLERLTNLSKQDWIVLRNIRNRIITELSEETGVVAVRVKMQDPLIAALVADEVVQMLSEYITQNRTEKARRNFEFIEKRFEEAKQRFEQSQQELATFNDENRGQLTAVARTEEQLLQSQYQLNFNLYNSMAERMEEARIQLQEETPVINVLEPAAVPDQKSEPKPVLILAAFIVFGGVIGVGIVIVTPFWIQLKSGINQ